MATRAVIAIPQSGLTISTPESLLDFRGRYHHWDGYPQMLGRTLFEAYRGHFGKNLERMVDYLIYRHVEWEQINECNLSLPARGVETEEWVTIRRTPPKETPPSCFCHDRDGNLLYNNLSDERYWYTPLIAYKEGITWVYILASLGKEDCMGICVNVWHVLKEEQLSQYNWGWGLISLVALRKKEPDWDAIESEGLRLHKLPAYGIYGTNNGESVVIKADSQNIPWAKTAKQFPFYRGK